LKDYGIKGMGSGRLEKPALKLDRAFPR
jgi:hypothetical protein